MLVTPSSGALWLVTLLAQLSPAAEAAPAPASPATSASATRQQVRITIASAGSDAEQLSLALADAMRRLDVEPSIERVQSLFEAGPGRGTLPPPDAQAPPATARLLIDVTASRSVALYVVDDRRQRVFVRRFSAAAGADELTIEKLVLSASSSVEAILAGQLIGVARHDFEAASRPPPSQLPSPPQAAAPRAQARGYAALTGSYAASWLGSETLSHGPGLGLELERGRFGLRLAIQGRLPVVVGPDAPGSVQVRLTTLGFRFRAFHQLPLAARQSALLGLGFGADFTQVSPRSSGPDAAIALAPYWAADGVLQGVLGFRHRATGFELGLALGVDWGLGPVRYVVDAEPRDQLVFAPQRVRPFLELEFVPLLLP